MPNSFTIYPAIDILEGNCVRLYKGDYKQQTIYNASPLAVARKWKEEGAEFLHIVDLDAAKAAEPVNLKLIVEISQELGIPVQTGGGIRNFETAKKILDAGVARIILGSVVGKDPDFTKRALEEWGERVLIGMDCRNGKLAFSGWLEDSDISAIDAANKLKEYGLSRVIYTDIERDGTLEGPNISELREFAQSTGIETIASGGMSQSSDIEELQKIQSQGIPINGAIIGKALYTGAIQLSQSLRL